MQARLKEAMALDADHQRKAKNMMRWLRSSSFAVGLANDSDAEDEREAQLSMLRDELEQCELQRSLQTEQLRTLKAQVPSRRAPRAAESALPLAGRCLPLSAARTSLHRRSSRWPRSVPTTCQPTSWRRRR